MPYLWVFQFPPFLFLIVAIDLALFRLSPRPPPSDLLLHVLDRGYRLYRRGHGSLLKGIPPAGVIAAHSGDHDPALPGSPRGTWASIIHRVPILAEAERWVTCILAIFPAWAAAALVLRWMPRARQSEWAQTAAAFLQGALIGFALHIGLILVFSLAPWTPAAHTALEYFFAVSLVAGRALGWHCW